MDFFVPGFEHDATKAEAQYKIFIDDVKRRLGAGDKIYINDRIREIQYNYKFQKIYHDVVGQNGGYLFPQTKVLAIFSTMNGINIIYTEGAFLRQTDLIIVTQNEFIKSVGFNYDSFKFDQNIYA